MTRQLPSWISPKRDGARVHAQTRGRLSPRSPCEPNGRGRPRARHGQAGGHIVGVWTVARGPAVEAGEGLIPAPVWLNLRNLTSGERSRTRKTTYRELRASEEGCQGGPGLLCCCEPSWMAYPSATILPIGPPSSVSTSPVALSHRGTS